MASMRDAMARLQIIYENTVPEAIAAKQAELGLSEFQKLRKRIHADVRTVRHALSEREALLTRHGTSPETAEASYRIRIMIKALKEGAGRMQEIVNKENKKRKNVKDKEKLEEMDLHVEIMELTNRHIEEVENLEKRRFNENFAIDRTELLAGGKTGVGIGGHRGVGTYGGNYADGPGNGGDPFMNSALPDIDVEEDFKNINATNKDIDDDLDVIGAGVAVLKNLAENMGNELDKQNDDLQDIDKAVNTALDHVDNLNINMRRALDGMMQGDKFMINCILICVVLALVGFIASMFIG